MSGYLETREAVAILGRVLDSLLALIPVKVGREGSAFRRAIGDTRANAYTLIADGELGTELQTCFDECTAAGASLDGMELVRAAVMTEAPQYRLGTYVMTSSILFAAAQESIIVSGMEFVSRTDVQAIMARMVAVFDEIKLDIAENLDSASYQAMTGLAAATVNHLMLTELRLPEIVTYKMGGPMPSLAIANLIYGDGSRSNELEDENDVVHPAFMPVDVRALSQ